MPSKQSTWLLLASVSLTLGACGGGGGGSSGAAPPIQVTGPGGGTTSTPPTAPPPAGLVYPKALSGVVSPTDFAFLDSLEATAQGARIPATALTLRWLGQPATYGLKIAGIGEGQLRQNSANDPALQLISASGQVLMTGLDIPQARGRYAGLLYRWGDPFIAAAFGVPTGAAGVPTTGVKTYSPVPQGYNLKINVDFAARRITGTIDLAWVDAWGPYPPLTYTLTPTSFAAGETSFSVPFSIPGAPSEGLVTARFAGPNAEELMVSWRGQVKSIYDNSWEMQGGLTVLSAAP